MLVKIQISQFSSDSNVHMLIYDKKRSVRIEQVATPEILKKMKGRPKAFFNAVMNKPKGAEPNIDIQEEAPWQNW